MMSLVVYAYNTNNQKFEAGELGVTGQPELQSENLPLRNSKGKESRVDSMYF